MNKDKLKLIRDILIYSFVTLLSFIVFLYFTFPINKLKSFIEEDFKKDTGLTLTLEEINTHFVTGIILKNSVIMDKKNSPILSLKKLKLWINPIKLLFKKIALSIESELYGGKLNGFLGRGGKSLQISMDAKNIGLDKVEILKSRYETNLKGKLGSSIKLKTESKNLGRTDGNIDLNGENIFIENTKIETPFGPLLLPPISFKKIGCKLAIKGGKGELTGCELLGSELNAKIKGGINLLETFQKSTIDLVVEFTTMGSIEEKFGIIFQNFFKKKADGSYSCKVTGSLANPMVLPEMQESMYQPVANEGG